MVVSYRVVFNSGAGLQVWRGSADCAFGAGGEDQLGECLQTGGWGRIGCDLGWWGGVEAVFVVGQPACSILGEGRGTAFSVHLLTWRGPLREVLEF